MNRIIQFVYPFISKFITFVYYYYWLFKYGSNLTTYKRHAVIKYHHNGIPYELYVPYGFVYHSPKRRVIRWNDGTETEWKHHPNMAVVVKKIDLDCDKITSMDLLTGDFEVE